MNSGLLRTHKGTLACTCASLEVLYPQRPFELGHVRMTSPPNLVNFYSSLALSAEYWYDYGFAMVSTWRTQLLK